LPFTPFHLGPALSLGLPLRKYIHAPTFILANVAVDVEPFLVLFLRLNYPLHGSLHTYAFAFLLGLGLGLGMFFLETFLRPVYKVLLLEPNRTFGIRAFMVAGALGTMLHVLFDSPLYADIQPFYPMTTNPLYNSVSSLEIYLASVWLGILGVVFYAGLLFFHAYGRFVKKSGKNKPSTMSN
jgi:hypothetical protein